MKYDELKRKMSASSVRRKPRHIESGIQQACVSWFRLRYPQYLCFSVPNGGSRNSIEAYHLKKEGALAGVSDLIVVAHCSVLFVEMKNEKGRQTEFQKDFQRKVEMLGFEYAVCRSLDDFMGKVSEWLSRQYAKNAE